MSKRFFDTTCVIAFIAMFPLAGLMSADRQAEEQAAAEKAKLGKTCTIKGSFGQFGTRGICEYGGVRGGNGATQ